MKVRVEVIDQGTKEVLIEGISPTIAKEYISQRDGQVKMTQDWDAVPYERAPGIGMRVAILRKMWVRFPKKHNKGIR